MLDNSMYSYVQLIFVSQVTYGLTDFNKSLNKHSKGQNIRPDIRYPAEPFYPAEH